MDKQKQNARKAGKLVGKAIRATIIAIALPFVIIAAYIATKREN